MNNNLILVALNLISKVTIFVVTIAMHLTIIIIKQCFYFVIGCFKVFPASTNTKITAVLLICVSILDASIVYKFTDNYRYSPYIHFLIISSPFFYIASVGKRKGILEKEVYANDK